MELRVLGPLEVVDDASALVELRGAKLSGLLVLLALQPGAVVPTTRIVEALWGEKDIRDPSNAVQVLVSKLRRSLAPLAPSGRSLVITSAVGYSLDVDPTTIDAVRFEGLAQDGRRLLERGLHESAAVVLRQGLAIWRGPALADFADAEFVQGDRARLEELQAGTLELAIEADLELGRHAELLGELEALVADHPLRERLRGQQMLALYRCGRQTDALRVFQTARRYLGDELGLEPGPELQRLEAAILAHDPSLDVEPGTTVERRSGNLPVPISSFVGRSAEAAQVRELLAHHRLVTLTGPGGAGKSRLALEAATSANSSMRDGAWLVELASLTDTAHIGPAVATAIGLDDLAHLHDYVANRQMLILLDNCEHLIDGAAAIAAQVLHAGAGVVVLATSREGLGVTGEQQWSVPPMSAEDATALFVDRSASDDGSDAPDQVAMVEEICGRLDGLPLAVELAAARTRTLSLDDIAARLDDRFRLLTTGDRNAAPRQRTLRDVVDWSHDLLFADEQRVLRRLSVFAGGFGIAAAESVTSGDDVPSRDVVDIVGHLVDKSLVVLTTRDGDTRFHLLQTLVDYGRLRLREAGEEEHARTRHLEWMVDLADAAEVGFRGPDQLAWVSVLGSERDNVRTAIEWALASGRAADASAIIAGLSYGWYVSGAASEGRALIGSVLAHGDVGSAEHRALVHTWFAWLSQFAAGMTKDVVHHAERGVEVARGTSSRVFGVAAVVASLVRGVEGRTDGAVELIDEAAERLVDEPDAWGQAWVDWARSGLALKVGDPEEAATALRRSVEGFASEGDRCGGAVASIRLSEMAEGRGDDDEAIAAATSAYETFLAFGVQAFNASTLATRLGNLAAEQGRFDDASEWHDHALSRAREGAYPGAIAQALSGMARAAGLQGRDDDAEAWHREALAIYRTSGSVEGTAASLASLGSIAAGRGDHRRALELYEQSFAQASLGRDQRAIALAADGMAESSAVLAREATIT